MLKIEKILCPVDFSECSAQAYGYACSLARHYEARLFVQHVAEQWLSLYGGYITQAQVEQVYAHQSAEAQERFRELADSPGEGVEQEFVFQRGDPAADSILLFAEDHQVDLIVMGTHGRRGLDRLMVGSVLERVLRKTRCPILAVRNRVQNSVRPETEERGVDVCRILFCTDFSDDSPRALEYALSLALQYNAELSLLHVLEGSRSEHELDGQKQEALVSLQKILPAEATQWASAIPVVRAGRAYQEIIQYAAEVQSDVIVMGVRGRNAVDIALFGSTTHRVIQLGSCPVLVVRT
jgi:nucleotide-binding universal stress UspA family protein